ncbi:low molecular weight protein-tyrosine-phosphatase [Mesorhizobium denitrificans]|uniref:protein-tyrosine-phosphatase n=1 Tax=Mesorhizobium denitrificans TaxID=2294114 RepID=A0A371XGR4_9HYPH|nr:MULTISPECIES: low molecular weight protein-tyrosine-phosphatase [Mesorhizobium]RFC68422.1 low molecular weight phosphotyrosine protein phosphatase [Mesorhizobium denitrificans]
MTSQWQYSVLFVCLGNICRSPLAEGLFRDAVRKRGWDNRFVIDSAGIGAWHQGSPPDPRSIAVAARYGIDISDQRARKIRPDDFERFDLVMAMDRSNVDDLRRVAEPEARGRIHLFNQYALGPVRDVPDPYYGGNDGFESVYRMLREASDGLAIKLGERMSAPSGQASSTT